MNKPLLSVIMPYYNHGKFIKRSLTAICQQSYEPKEIIVIDDCSTDDSLLVLRNLVRQYPYLKVYTNETNMGVVATCNKGIEIACGEYIACLAADDMVLSGFFEKSMDMLMRNPQAGLCYSYPSSFRNGSKEIYINPIYWYKKAHFFTPEELAQNINGGYIAGHTCIYKKEALLAAGAHDPELRWHCDWFTNLVIAFRYGACFIPEPLSAIFTSDETYSSTGRSNPVEQGKVLRHLLRLLNGEQYEDVLPYFIRGDVLCHFDQEPLDALKGHPELCSEKTAMLINSALWVQRNRPNSYRP